jgi:predicted  nucleic acid-binding Zn-ribbon protein
MNPDLELLIHLQTHDLELKKLRAELADAPVRVSAAQTARAKAEVALTAAKNSLAKEMVLRNSQETDATALRGKIDRLRKQMESATSAAQISALEHEITFAEQSISRLEDEEIASLERTDVLEAEKSRLADLLATNTAALEAARAHAAQVKESNTAAIAAIEAERAELRPSISENILSNYDRIAKGKGTALSEGRDHKCSACQMVVRPQRWNDLTDRDPNGEFANTIFNCETCGRMLYYDPRRDAPVASPSIDKLHHAENT